MLDKIVLPYKSGSLPIMTFASAFFNPFSVYGCLWHICNVQSYILELYFPEFSGLQNWLRETSCLGLGSTHFFCRSSLTFKLEANDPSRKTGKILLCSQCLQHMSARHTAVSLLNGYDPFSL